MTGVPGSQVETPEAIAKGSGQNPREHAIGGTNHAVLAEHPHEGSADLLSAVLERSNMLLAYERVMRNKGAPGIDGLTVGELKAYLKSHWQQHKADLLAGHYQPQAVKKVEIPKPSGGMRQLGIPTVLDRLIQQALHQVLSPLFDSTFSPSSYGFRPGRSAGQAVCQARTHVETGKRWVVDLDLERFFDRVNHDILMSRIARKVKDKRVLKLIRAYLESGICEGGMTTARRTGTPQGGPLSPLLSNILLDDLDKELEQRGHAFCRYADDVNIYVNSQRAGERVLVSITHWLAKHLKLQVNPTKSAVDRPWKRKFLGYTVCSRKYNVRLRISPEAVKRFKADIKVVIRRGRGCALGKTIETLNPKLRGWLNYFQHIGVKDIVQELDGWLRRHLRKVLWRQWKRSRTRFKQLMQLGLDEKRAQKSAYNGRGAWWNAGASHMNQALPKKWFDRRNLLSLVDYQFRLKCLT